MGVAYLDNNRRDYEITRHISPRLHDPLSVIALKETGSCTITLPEALFDADYPGHYFRRIRSVAVSIPCVVGPYASVNCKLTLLKSCIRKAPQLKDGQYARGDEDDRSVAVLRMRNGTS